jgi:hypothetical protein
MCAGRQSMSAQLCQHVTIGWRVDGPHGVASFLMIHEVMGIATVWVIATL